MLPSEGVEARYVGELPRRAVGLRGIEGDVAGEADNAFDEVSEVGDGEFEAGAEVETSPCPLTTPCPLLVKEGVGRYCGG
jgi:hypothetical protein